MEINDTIFTETETIIICRLCLETTAQDYCDIFDEANVKMQLPRILAEHFWFSTKEDDIYSKFICTDCCLKVQEFNSFYERIIEVHKAVFPELHSNYYKIPKLDFPDESTFSFVKVEEGQQVQILEESSSFLDNSFVDNVEEFALVDVIDEVNNESYSITQLDNVELDNLNADVSIEDSAGSDKIAVDQIDLENKRIQQHFKMECDICKEAFDNFRKIKFHFTAAHKQKGYLMCCKKKIYRRYRLLEHIQEHTNPEGVECLKCSKIFADTRKLTSHMETHVSDDKKEFKCTQCSKSFVRKFKLMRHELWHQLSEKRPFACEKCDKSFASQAILQTHIKGVHEKTLAHVCDICAKVFKSKGNFESHYKIFHSGYNPERVQCNICGSWLKHEISLKKHMVRHDDEKKELKCKICGKVVPNRDALRSHTKYSHIAKRSHKCGICEKAFKNAISLKEHMTMHTGEVLYTCPFCPKTFNSRANMYAHRKRAHLKEWEETFKK